MSSMDPESTRTPRTEEVESLEGVDPDTESDPGHDEGESADWSSEGGATAEGPATDTEADDG